MAGEAPKVARGTEAGHATQSCGGLCGLEQGEGKGPW